MSDERLESAVARGWGLPDEVTEADLLDVLAERVAWLMKHDYERLLSAVYLLDVPESKFRQAASLGTNAATANALAEIILDREREKFESRRRYRRERSTDVRAEDVDEGKLPP